MVCMHNCERRALVMLEHLTKELPLEEECSRCDSELIRVGNKFWMVHKFIVEIK
jgi:hypothetical protein